METKDRNIVLNVEDIVAQNMLNFHEIKTLYICHIKKWTLFALLLITILDSYNIF